MKKALAFILSIILCFSCSALASGFGGLGINTSGTSGSAAMLPDPAEVMDEVYGTLINSSYEFTAGYFCDVYAYEKPRNIDSVVNSYSGLCRDAGYTVTETIVEGQTGYTIQNGDGLYAILFPDVNGQMLFMVQNGMAFSPKTRINYAVLTYNGRTYEYTIDKLGSDYIYSFGDVYSWQFICHAEGNSPFSYLSFEIPVGVTAGTEYYITEDSDVPGFGLSAASTSLLNPLDESEYFLRGYDDYAYLVITRSEETDRGLLLEGVFSCSLDEGDVVFENLTFSVLLRE